MRINKIDEAYFDQKKNGVQPISMDEVFNLIPSRVRNGKKVIVFIHEDLVPEFREHGQSYSYNFGIVPITRMMSDIDGRFNEWMLENVQDGIYDVILIKFDDEEAVKMTCYDLDPEVCRKYSVFVIDTDETHEVDEIHDRYGEKVYDRDNDFDNDDDYEDLYESMSARRRRSIRKVNESLDSEEVESKPYRPAEHCPIPDTLRDEDIEFVDSLVPEDEDKKEAIRTGSNGSYRLEEIILKIKKYVDDADASDNFDDDLFRDMVLYLFNNVLGMFITDKENEEVVESVKYLLVTPLNESLKIFKKRKADRLNEASVRDQFNKYSKVFESEEEKGNEEEKKKDKDTDGEKKSDIDNKKNEEKSEDEETPITAIVVKVSKDDADKAKRQMIDKGVAEEDIDVIDGDDESDDTELVVSVNSIDALRSWLDAKGVDLEEMLGGEIVSEDEEEASEEDEKKDSENSDEEPDLRDADFDDFFKDE